MTPIGPFGIAGKTDHPGLNPHELPRSRPGDFVPACTRQSPRDLYKLCLGRTWGSGGRRCPWRRSPRGLSWVPGAGNGPLGPAAATVTATKAAPARSSHPLPWAGGLFRPPGDSDMRTCWGPLGQAHEVHPLPLQRRVRVGAADLAVAAEQRAVCGGFWKGLPRGPGEHGPAPGRPSPLRGRRAVPRPRWVRPSAAWARKRSSVHVSPAIPAEPAALAGSTRHGTCRPFTYRNVSPR